MEVIEHYKSAIESTDEHQLKAAFPLQVRIEIPGWSKRQSCSEHSILSPESSRQDRFWNQICFNGGRREQLILPWL